MKKTKTASSEPGKHMEKYKADRIRINIISRHIELTVFTRSFVGKNYKLIILLHFILYMN